VVVLESFMGMRVLTEAVTIVTFKSFGCKSVYNVLSNIGPLYSTGMDSGIVVDIGFQQAQILPIVRSRLCLEGLEVSYCGGCTIEKQLNQMLLEDNEQNARMIDKMDKKLPVNFKSDVIEGIKTRCLFVMSKAQRTEYMKDEENISKMKAKKYVLGNGKVFKDAQYIACSFYTRACAMEILYGDPSNEEPNLAHAICKSVLKVSGLLVLTGTA
jgi:actin-related protein